MQDPGVVKIAYFTLKGMSMLSHKTYTKRLLLFGFLITGLFSYAFTMIDDRGDNGEVVTHDLHTAAAWANHKKVRELCTEYKKAGTLTDILFELAEAGGKEDAKRTPIEWALWYARSTYEFVIVDPHGIFEEKLPDSASDDFLTIKVLLENGATLLNKEQRDISQNVLGRIKEVLDDDGTVRDADDFKKLFKELYELRESSLE